jgi:phage anti-repressor protein
MTDFNVDTALTILNVDADDADFVINFDDAWQWVGYTRKDHGMRALRENFTEGVDYSLLISRETLQDGTYSHYQHTVTLTKDCFKGFCLMARTAKGRDVRNYFIRLDPWHPGTTNG